MLKKASKLNFLFSNKNNLLLDSQSLFALLFWQRTNTLITNRMPLVAQKTNRDHHESFPLFFMALSFFHPIFDPIF
ncbi:MAG: hypothetical protein EBS28_02245, partial [Chlamydiae bacterium]|nr:hypothetical protein [Chlamydiota bacterium]